MLLKHRILIDNDNNKKSAEINSMEKCENEFDNNGECGFERHTSELMY